MSNRQYEALICLGAELDCVVDSATGTTYVWIYKAKRRA